eukprot:1157376-Pelagomonas_calceolata.AAC.11
MANHRFGCTMVGVLLEELKQCKKEPPELSELSRSGEALQVLCVLTQSRSDLLVPGLGVSLWEGNHEHSSCTFASTSQICVQDGREHGVCVCVCEMRGERAVISRRCGSLYVGATIKMHDC